MSKSLKVTVTALDANYMAGSAMFLIESAVETTLYTGYFRFDR